MRDDPPRCSPTSPPATSGNLEPLSWRPAQRLPSPAGGQRCRQDESLPGSRLRARHDPQLPRLPDRRLRAPRRRLLPSPGRDRDRPPGDAGGRLDGRPAGAGAQRQGHAARRAPRRAAGGGVDGGGPEAEVLVGAPKALPPASWTVGWSASARRRSKRSDATARPSAAEARAPALRRRRHRRSGTRSLAATTRRTSSPSATATSSCWRGPAHPGPRRPPACRSPHRAALTAPRPPTASTDRRPSPGRSTRIADRERRRQMPLLGPQRRRAGDPYWGEHEIPAASPRPASVQGPVADAARRARSG